MNPILAGLIGLILGAALAWFLGVRFNQAELKKQTLQKRALLDSAAQQLRTPLNDVLGLVQTLSFRSQDFSAEHQELIGTIAGAGANVKSVLLDVFDILDFEFGQMRLKRNVELLPEMVEFIRRTNQKRAEDGGVKLIIEMKPSARAWLLIDDMRVRQCVAAMVRQCILQSKGGAVNVVVDVLQSKKNKAFRRIVVTASDKSPGMDQDEAERYFSAKDFSRNKLLMSSGASPLSLIVARLLAREMGGDLTVKSAPGRGVMFRLNIAAKFARVAAEDSHASDLSAFDAASGIMPERVVLAVEDNVVNMRVLQAFLGRVKPKKILTAANGQEALDILEKEKCDVVLMDVQMPVMDGLTATKKIRAANAPWRNIPIIAISAAATNDERDACLDAGMNAFLPKPVSADELYERLVRVCSQ